MPTTFVAHTRTERAVIVATAKLPDDIDLREFNDLNLALTKLCAIASNPKSPRGRLLPPVGETAKSEDFVLKRVQYGSDFEVVLSIVGHGVAGAALLAATFVSFSKGLVYLADAGVKREERLALRDARLAARAKRKFVESRIAADDKGRAKARGVSAQKRFALLQRQREFILPSQYKEQLNALLPPELRVDGTYIALSQLAEYGVRIHVEKD